MHSMAQCGTVLHGNDTTILKLPRTTLYTLHILGCCDDRVVAAPAVWAAVSVVLHPLLCLLCPRVHLLMIRQLQQQAHTGSHTPMFSTHAEGSCVMQLY